MKRVITLNAKSIGKNVSVKLKQTKAIGADDFFPEIYLTQYNFETDL
jgi:hypothetical protein